VIRCTNKQTDLVWYEFVDCDVGLRHAFLTRLGGVSQKPFSSLNLGSTVGDDPDAVKENHWRVYTTFNFQATQVVSPYQVHQNHVVRVSSQDGGTIIPSTDALITNKPGLVLLLRFADCVPVLLYDPVHHAAGLVHAGWRGLAAGVIPACVQAMKQEFGTQPHNLWAGIGPAICQKHYPVNLDVIDAISITVPNSAHIAGQIADQWHADLPGTADAQLHNLNIQRISHAAMCPACHTAEWYSHRAESGKTGRFGVFVMLP
jgi:YfiH family protein